MYVSGETAEASAETTGMIEEIVRQQVIEMVCRILLITFHPIEANLISYDNVRNKLPVEEAGPFPRMT